MKELCLIILNIEKQILSFKTEYQFSPTRLDRYNCKVLNPVNDPMVDGIVPKYTKREFSSDNITIIKVHAS